MIAFWNRFWFGDGEESYDPMGLVRMLAVAIYGWFRLRRELWEMEIARDVPHALVPDNFGLELLPLQYPLGDPQAEVLKYTLALACVFGFVGFLTRPAMFVLAIGATWLSAGYASLHYFNHELVLTLAFFWILAVYPSGRSFSVDAAIRWWMRGRGEGRPASDIFSMKSVGPWAYKLALLTMAVVYMTAGVSKMRYSDGDWHSGETLAFYMSRTDAHQLYLGATWERLVDEPWKSPVPLVDHGYGGSATEFSRGMASSPLFMRVTALATLALELGGFLMLGPAWLAAAFMVSAIVMHSTIGATMGLGFLTYRMYLVLLIDWPGLAATWRRFRGQG